VAPSLAVLLIDEPFDALDAQTREVLQEEMLRIWQHERKTVIFVTHSISDLHTVDCSGAAAAGAL
jgi:ABC-type nitrate/sulfonate/bicarbonate transport system ATPase subunit